MLPVLRTPLLLLPLLLLLGAACGKDESADTTPPALPRVDRIGISAPDAQGKLRVVGEAGAVEGSASVELENNNSGAVLRGAATGSGAFALQIAGALLDNIRIVAIDEAGNRSASLSLLGGEPFTLSVAGGDGQSGPVTTVLPLPLGFELLAGDGGPAPGLTLTFVLAALDGGFNPPTATTDALGRVETLFTPGETAGPFEVLAVHTGVVFADAESITGVALPGPPAALGWVAGDGQKDAPGETLLAPLRLQVADAYGNGIAGEAVSVAASGAGSVSPASGETGAEGFSTSWTLDGELEQTLTASHATLADAVASASTDDPPSIASINPFPHVIDPNIDFIDADGLNFCATAQYNTLTLGGTELTIVSATESHIKARVPTSIAPGVHTLRLSVGHQQALETFEVEVSVPLGTIVDYPAQDGAVEFELLVPAGGTEYVLVPYSLRNWNPLDGLPAEGLDPYEYASRGYGLDAANPLPGSERSAVGWVDDFHRRVLTERGSAPHVGPIPQRGREVAERATFKCLSDPFGSIYDASAYSQVVATLRYNGPHALIYVDDDTPSILENSHVNDIGQRFDVGTESIYSVDRSYFGAETDRDGNGKVVILLTPVVNAMTQGSGGGYIGGFFNPADLDIWSAQDAVSNHGEFFYSIVPDPNGIFGSVPHQLEDTVENIKIILAHEFQHLINTGQRHLVQGNLNSPQEHLWLNEGLSHLAEQLSGFTIQNFYRVGTFLHGDGHRVTSLTQGSANLAERGAAYLYCRYIEDRWPGTVSQLVGGPESGAANVAAHIPGTFEQSFKDWAAAIYLDDRDLDGDELPDDLGAAYRFDSHNIREDFFEQGGGDPLTIPILSFDSPAWNSFIVPTGIDYLKLQVEQGGFPPPGGSLRLELTGNPAMEMGVLVIRVGQ